MKNWRIICSSVLAYGGLFLLAMSLEEKNGFYLFCGLLNFIFAAKLFGYHMERMKEI